MKQVEVLEEVFESISDYINDLKQSIESGQNLVRLEKKAPLQNEVNVIEQQMNHLYQKRERIINIIENSILSIGDGKVKTDEL